MIAKKGDMSLYVNPDLVKKYADNGFDIYKDNGEKVEDPGEYTAEQMTKKIRIGEQSNG